MVFWDSCLGESTQSQNEKCKLSIGGICSSLVVLTHVNHVIREVK